MDRTIKRIGLATALFVGALLVPWSVLLGWRTGVEFGILAIVVTPPIWWWLVARRPEARQVHGAAAGVLIFFLVYAIWLTRFYLVIHSVEYYKRGGLTSPIDGVVALGVLIGGAIETPLGALLGSLTVVLQRRLEAPPRA